MTSINVPGAASARAVRHGARFPGLSLRGGLLATLCLAGAAGAGPEEEAQILAAVKKFVPNLEVSEIRPSPSPDVYQVRVGSDLLYVTKDGHYAFNGSMWDLRKRVNLTSLGQQSARVDALAALSDEDYIEFAPATGYQDVVHVFTDVDCGYCRKLHQHIQEFNRNGIAVRYLAYPRAGLSSSAAKTMEAVWCSVDQRSAMTQAKQGIPLDAVAACDAPVKNQYELGRRLGVQGTPAVINAEGASTGYLDPTQMLKFVGRE